MPLCRRRTTIVVRGERTLPNVSIRVAVRDCTQGLSTRMPCRLALRSHIGRVIRREGGATTSRGRDAIAHPGE